MSRSSRPSPPPQRIPDDDAPDSSRPTEVTKLNRLAHPHTAKERDDAQIPRPADSSSRDIDAAWGEIVSSSETMRAAPPSPGLRARSRSSRPPARIIRGPDGTPRFVDDDAGAASSSEVTRSVVIDPDVLERTRKP